MAAQSDWMKWFDAQIGTYRSLMHYLWEVWIYNAELIYDIRGNRIQPPATVLELGCGSGLEVLSVLAAHGYQVTGVDVEEDVLAFAKENFERLGLSGEFLRGDMFNLKLDRQFDLVYSVGVIEHFMTREKIVQAVKIHRQLSRQWVILLVPTQFVYDEAKKLDTFGNTPDWVALSAGDLESIAQEADLKIVTTFGYGRCDGPFAETNQKRSVDNFRTLCVVCRV